MNRCIHLISGLIAATGIAFAKVITVDNKPGSVAMFSSAQAAVDAAEPGDTIQLAGSPTGYGGIRLIKRLDIVGPGWLLEDNNVPGLNRYPAQVSVYVARDVNGSSSGSTFTGLELSGWWNEMGEHGILAEGHTLDRCRFVWNGSLVRFDGRVTITRCLLSNFSLDRTGSSIRNSIIRGDCSLGLGVAAANCVFEGSISGHELSSVSGSVFFGRNSTTRESFLQTFKGSVDYCMATGVLDGATFLPSGGGNINGVPTELAFVWTGSADGRWQLRPNSPARGTGFNGTDIGPFGGPFPYVLSGVPPVPRVTRFVVPSTVTSTSGLRFEVDAQSF